MIPDRNPSQECLEKRLRELADLVENGTIDPRDVQDASMTSSEASEADSLHDEAERDDAGCPKALDGEPENQAPQPAIQQPSRVSRNKKRPSAGCPGTGDRPDSSYIELIGRALNSDPDLRMKLVDIYAWIKDHYPFFQTCNLAWKVGVPWVPFMLMFSR